MEPCAIITSRWKRARTMPASAHGPGETGSLRFSSPPGLAFAFRTVGCRRARAYRKMWNGLQEKQERVTAQVRARSSCANGPHRRKEEGVSRIETPSSLRLLALVKRGHAAPRASARRRTAQPMPISMTSGAWRAPWGCSPTHSRRKKRASIREDRGLLRMSAAQAGEVAPMAALAQRLTVMMARRRARRRAPAEAGRREHVPPPRRSDGAGALDARVLSRRARRGTSAGG